MVIRNLDESPPHDTLHMSGRAPLPAGAHHPPEDRRLSPHHGWQPPAHRDRQRKLQTRVTRNENISRLCWRLFVYLEISFCLTICADRLADDQLYSALPCAINCYSSGCNRDCYLLHYIIKTDHEYVISYSISTLGTLLLFMGGLQNLWSHWIIIPHYVSIHISIKHYTLGIGLVSIKGDPDVW